MDLEVVGRHALLFDDDATAAFVNSGDALVEWHSLQIDRYDVRHLLFAPPPPRRRNRNSEPILSDDPSLESRLDQERYIDLPLHSDQTEVEDDEKPLDKGGYRAVAFSYGETDDSANQKKTDADMESSRFLPPFPIPGNLLQNLPSTEKVHQIIARTAMFVSKHGGQSEFILRVKQGDNPAFGFLMPDHHLHPYFRILVEHPELLHSEYDGKSQDEGKKGDSEHHNENDVGGALSLLGSVYGSGEEEDIDDNAKTEKDVSQDNSNAVNNFVSHGSKKMDFNADAARDESVSRNTIPSIKEKVLSVKNSLITAIKSGSVKGIKKEGKSGSFSSAAKKAKSSAVAMAFKIEPLILEPPSELKSLIDKLVEFIMRNGKQFEATLIEQDSKHGRFPFLLPSNQYHPYYLKVLQTAQEAKTNGKSFYSVKDDLVGRGMDRKTSLPKENDFSSFDYAFGDIPLESDRKEKFKMVISKSKKEAQETQSKGTHQECGIAVDAAAAAAILQAAIRGIDDSNFLTISSTPLNVHSHVNGSKGNQPASLGSLLLSQPANADRNGSHSVPDLASKATVRTSQAARETDCSEAHLTEEQKVKAERLKRAKMFIAMLKSGAVPFKGGTSRASSVDPLESGVSRSASEVNLTGKEREGSLAPTNVERLAIVEKPKRFYFGEEHSERLARRKYRSRSGECEEDVDDDDADKKKHNEGRSRAKYRSRSGRPDEDDENENGEEMEQKPYRRRHQSQSSSDEKEDEEESNEEDRDHEHFKVKHPTHHSQHEDDGREEKYKEMKDYKQSRKKHRSHHSSRKRRSSKQCSHEENEHDVGGREQKHSRKKHRSHRSSYHSREKHMHRNRHSSRDKESRGHLKHDISSDDEHQNCSSSDKRKKDFYDERDELEEGEISSRVPEESRGIASGHVSRETSVDVLSSHQSAPSQPSETTSDVPDDLRAKIRAMLMATR